MKNRFCFGFFKAVLWRGQVVLASLCTPWHKKQISLNFRFHPLFSPNKHGGTKWVYGPWVYMEKDSLPVPNVSFPCWISLDRTCFFLGTYTSHYLLLIIKEFFNSKPAQLSHQFKGYSITENWIQLHQMINWFWPVVLRLFRSGTNYSPILLHIWADPTKSRWSTL